MYILIENHEQIQKNQDGNLPVSSIVSVIDYAVLGGGGAGDGKICSWVPKAPRGSGVFP